MPSEAEIIRQLEKELRKQRLDSISIAGNAVEQIAALSKEVGVAERKGAMLAAGFVFGHICRMLDQGEDPRQLSAAEVVDQVRQYLGTKKA